MFIIVDLLFYVLRNNTPSREDTQQFLASLENLCTDKQLQKVSVQYLDTNIEALKYSSLEQSDQMIKLLNEIKSNEKLSTNHQNVLLRFKSHITITEDTDYKVYKELYTFKHPATGTCTESGSQCGFILRASKTDGYWTHVLCTKNEDYTDTGIHFHDVISTHDMSWYTIMLGKTDESNEVTTACRWNWRMDWLPNVAEWEGVRQYIAYNVTDFHIAKQQ